jgi:disulfide bond formation protein DsbB
MKISIKHRFLLIGILIFSILALLIAYFIEHALGHIPCNLCLIERIPFLASIVLVSLVLILNKYEKIVSFTVGLFFLFGAIISFYHFGIEQGFFNESVVCDLTNINKVTSAQELLKELEKKTISCKDVTLRVFGFSLATFNTITSLSISVMMLRIGVNYEKNK